MSVAKQLQGALSKAQSAPASKMSDSTYKQKIAASEATSTKNMNSIQVSAVGDRVSSAISSFVAAAHNAYVSSPARMANPMDSGSATNIENRTNVINEAINRA
jgi:hypothetical protein